MSPCLNDLETDAQREERLRRELDELLIRQFENSVQTLNGLKPDKQVEEQRENERLIHLNKRLFPDEVSHRSPLEDRFYTLRKKTPAPAELGTWNGANDNQEQILENHVSKHGWLF